MTYDAAKNPLIRDGVAQQQRQNAALDPKYAQVDETDLADFLTFAYRLSQRVAYFNLHDQLDGSWHDFFERSTPIQIALISKTRPETLRDRYEKALQAFLAQWAIAPAAAASSPSQRLAQLEPILKVYAELLECFWSWHQGLDNETPLKATIRASIRSNLLHLQHLQQLERGWLQRQSGKSSMLDRYINDLWAWVGHQGAVERDDGGSDRPLAIDMRQLVTNRIQAQARLNSIFQPLFQAYLQIIQQAAAVLPQSFSVDQSLEPHLALYVAFWEMLQPARDDLNQMTQRHLNFFYRKVLRLSEKPAQPDKAHIILELAKFQANHKLAKQTSFSAGTDATGVDLTYTLDEEIIVNPAQVAELKSIFLHRQPLDEQVKALSAAVGEESPERYRKVLGLHVSPIANSYDGNGGAFPKDQSVQVWLPFGDQTRPVAEIGLAIASSVLLLQEGDRTITFQITLNFPSALRDSELELLKTNLPHELFIDFSSTASWLRKTIQAHTLTPASHSPTAYILSFNVHLAVDEDPVLPYQAELPGGQLDTDRPVARLILRHQDAQKTSSNLQENTSQSQEASVYYYLQRAMVEAIAITTQVAGVRNLLLQNDLSVLDATKPFWSFGPQPKAGMNFYIGSQEVFHKHLTQLQMFYDLEVEPPRQENHIDWTTIYAAYGVPATFNPGVLAFYALRDRQWHSAVTEEEESTEPIHLFSDDSADRSPRYSIDLTSHLSALQLNRSVDGADVASLEPWSYQSKSGFVRSQLVGDDFRHADYPAVLARQLLATATQEIVVVARPESGAVTADPGNPGTDAVQAKNTSTDQNPITPIEGVQKRKAVIGAYYRSPEGTIFEAKDYYVNVDDVPLLPGEPYTPVLKSLQLDYTAIATQDDYQLFHLHPFDGFASLPEPQNVSFLPQFDQEGELLIGLQNLEPSTTLTLLFQVAEETADTNLQQTQVEWHYLKNNTWQKLDDHRILKDTSNGFIHSGIVKLAIPADISNTHTTILNPVLHWLKASVANRSGAVCHIISIQTQAAELTFADKGNDPNHLAVPLPANSLTKLVIPQTEISQIQQPYPSFGGHIKEQPARFYTRVSEHLRHKGRAITIFDYEHLVLEHFPEIYKVRCINHGQIHEQLGHGMTKTLNEVAPGHITLAVIPALSQRPSLNDLQPQVNINLLQEIEHYLTTLSSPWTEIRVINPQYEPIHVSLRVQFREPFHADFAYYQRQLERDIIGFLSPWTVDGGAEIHFGGEIYLSSILKFVEDLSYVDYVSNFKLFKEGQGPLLRATADNAQSILVSVPPREDGEDGKTAGIRHVIESVPAAHTSTRGAEMPKGLGYASLETLKLQAGETQS